MNVVLERWPPVMEHQCKTDLTAEPRGIASEGLQGGHGARKQEAVEELGVALGQGVELVQQGQGAVEGGNIEEISETCVDPAAPGEGLTLRTVAIATRVVPHDLRHTLIARRH